MAILLSAHQLRKAFAARPLFEGLTFSVESGERIGLIGPNGAGKSTLLRILASKDSVDAGTLSFQQGLRVGYLEQVPRFESQATVLSAVLAGTENPDDWECMSRAQECMSKLSLSGGSEVTGERRVAELSGGWKKRVALARELVRNPDLLLLDEPTNHLDVESILWLENFLATAPFATITVTHDRLFLQRIANRILELDRRNPGGLLSVRGTYADYIGTKEQLLQSQERREVVLKNTLRRETEWLRQGAKARTTKQQARIQRAGELANQVGELEYRNQSRSVRIEFQQAEKNPKKLIAAEGLSKTINGRVLFSDVNLLLSPGDRVGLLGPNGCGKSTLIRVLLGLDNAENGAYGGKVQRSEHLSVAYFEQNRETLDPTVSVSKTLCPLGEYVDYRGGRVHIKSYLDRFLFTSGQMDMAVGKLSGGEQSRLLIARLMLQEANLLVLDEPTNDLDIATLGVLEECLTDFPGAVLLVTHDRYFLDQVATRILAFDETGRNSGQVVTCYGLDQWESWYTEQRAEQARAAQQQAKGATRSEPALSVKKKKFGFNEKRELASMEQRIQEAEAELARLTQESEVGSAVTSTADFAKLRARLAEVTHAMAAQQKMIDDLYARWAELEDLSRS